MSVYRCEKCEAEYDYHPDRESGLSRCVNTVMVGGKPDACGGRLVAVKSEGDE